MDQKPETHQAQEPFLNNTNPSLISSLLLEPEEPSCGTHEVMTIHCGDDGGDASTEDDHCALSHDGLSDFSNSDISLSEVCVESNTEHFEEEINHEVQQASRIFSEFLTEKHKALTGPFFHPMGNHEAQSGIGGVHSSSLANARQSICLQRMEQKFIDKEYETITQFVADFRLMLENCYRYHGVDHWLSKQAQKLEILLEQKLTLLSRRLREKTTLAVTSKGRFAGGEEWISTYSTRRRQTFRSLKTLSVGGHESIMVQTLRLEEQQKAKEEKRQRELEKKEAEEMSAKEMDKWEKNLLSQASPHNVEILWELPAIGHFLCLAQTALNLPEIVFYELERCLLMPRCSVLLSKIMSSLMCPQQRRSTLHRRPVMPYRRWESELRQRVKDWYQSVGASHDQAAQAEQLGLCHQFFNVLGEVSPLETKAFHMLPFYHRVWLLKGLCDHVYETQRDIQDAVLAQPIHECRESILGYDSKENAYIHFPHFCGADLRIYCQSPCTSPTIPFPSVLVKKCEILHKLQLDSVNKSSDLSGTSFDEKSPKTEMIKQGQRESTDGEERIGSCHSCKPGKQMSFTFSDEADEAKVDSDTSSTQMTAHFRKRVSSTKMEAKTKFEWKSKRLEEEEETYSSFCHKTETMTQEHCLSIGEHCYTGRSPAGSVTVSTIQRIATLSTTQKDQKSSQCKNKTSSVKLEQHQHCCDFLGLSPPLSLERAHASCKKMVNDKMLTSKKEQRKKTGKKVVLMKHEQEILSDPEASMSSVSNRSIAIKRKHERKKHISGKAFNHLKKKKDQSEPSFKLVCTNLDELRELINKTEDELDDIESTSKRLNRWHNRRKAVKDLHSTLIRLLNELSPWEPKLIKAYQRNRLRLKKEFEVFKNHPESSIFLREECISSSSDDGDLGLLLEQTNQEHDDAEHVLPRGLGGTFRELSTELAAESPMTHTSYNHLKRSQSTRGDDLDNSDSPKPSFKFEPVPPSLKPLHSSSCDAISTQLHTVPLSKPNSLHTMSGKLNYIPIPTLLAKSVGNKVTLMKQPSYPMENDDLNQDSKRTRILSEHTNRIKSNDCSSGNPQNSQQKQSSEQSPKQVVPDSVFLPHPVSSSETEESLKESTKVFYTDNATESKSSTDLKCEEKEPQHIVILPSNIVLHKTNEANTSLQSKQIPKCNSKMDSMFCMSSSLSGFPISENKILVQQVALSKSIGQTDTQSSFSEISCLSKSQESANVARSAGRLHCSVQSGTLQCTPNCSAITSAPLGLLSTDGKEELKTVCIRESQSILVTTRGGNTGIVKVLKSSGHPACLSKSSAERISPQFQTYLIPNTSPLFSSDAAGSSDGMTTSSVQTERHFPSSKSNTKVTTSAKTTSISTRQEVSPFLSPTKCQTLTGLSGFSINVNKPVTNESCSPDFERKIHPFRNVVTSTSLTAADIISLGQSNKTNEDNRPQNDKLILIRSAPHGDVCFTKTLHPSVTLSSSPKKEVSLLAQGPSADLKQGSIIGAVQHVMKTPVTQEMCSVNSTLLLKQKAAFMPSGKSTDTPIPVPCLIATSVAQKSAVQPQSSKCKAAQMSITAPAFTNSDVISTGITIPASSLLKLGIPSITGVSQPGNVTCPSINLLTPTTFKNKHGLSTIMMPNNSNINPITLQSISKPVSPGTECKPLHSSNLSGGFDKSSLSLSLSFTKPDVSCTLPKIDTTKGNKDLSTQTNINNSSAPTGTATPQIVISPPMSLPGGAHIILNNTQFMVPAQSLGSDRHFFVISSNAPQQSPATSAKESVVPFQEVKQAPVLLQSTTKLPSVPAIGSSFGACTTAVAPSLQTSSFVTAAHSTGPNKTITNSVLPQVCTVLTSASTVVTPLSSKCSIITATSSPSSLLSPSTVLMAPFKADSVQLKAAATSCSQGGCSPTLSTQASTQLPSQHPANSIASVPYYSSVASKGHGSPLAQKQDPTGLGFH